MDITVLKEAKPVIEINFEEIKGELAKKLEEYNGLVVTEETLGACKDAQKELASLRVKIDTYRKDKKKELSAPITQFENMCKELIGYVEDAEKPLKEGIGFYDAQRRKEKEEIAQAIIDAVATEVGLNEAYRSRLTIVDKYCNLTAKQSDVKDDVEARAFALKVEQDREQELMQIVQDTIDEENKRLKFFQFSISDFEFQLKMGMSTSELIKLIRSRANEIYECENAKQTTPQDATEVKEEPKPVDKSGDQYIVSFEVTGSADEMRALSSFLKEHGYSYKTLSQKKVD